MKLYQHKKNKDTAFKILSKEGKEALVRFYNVNYAKISGELPIAIGVSKIMLQPMSDYRVLSFVDAPKAPTK